MTPQLRKKKVGKHTYRSTEANGDAYFGKVGEVAYKDAKHHFGEHIKQKQPLSTARILFPHRTFARLADHPSLLEFEKRIDTDTEARGDPLP